MRKAIRILGIASLMIELILLAVAVVFPTDRTETNAWLLGLFLVPIGLIFLLVSFLKK